VHFVGDRRITVCCSGIGRCGATPAEEFESAKPDDLSQQAADNLTSNQLNQAQDNQ